jgi:hypothetical protein
MGKVVKYDLSVGEKQFISRSNVVSLRVLFRGLIWFVCPNVRRFCQFICASNCRVVPVAFVK